MISVIFFHFEWRNIEKYTVEVIQTTLTCFGFMFSQYWIKVLDNPAAGLSNRRTIATISAHNQKVKHKNFHMLSASLSVLAS